jgi:phosphoribosylformylglycinamidine (FGAM) synthase PurS component
MSTTRSFEILGLFDKESDCHKLLYAPVVHPWTYRETQVYTVEFDGEASALEAFVERVLRDPISQELRDAATSAFPKAAFVLEYGMKGGALDLEKETILNYFRALPEPGFQLIKLTLRKRVYVFGEGADADPFVRDVCNPAIHTWEVRSQAAA